MAASTKIALTNVRVFDGACMREPSTVVIEGNVIGDDATGATEVDGHGAFLLPGLIDAHIHLNGVKSLEQLLRHGVTTGLDMASWPPARVDALRGLKDHTDIRSAGIPVTAPGTTHSRIPGFSKEALLSSPDQAPKYVADRVAEGSDYIKVIADIPGPDQATLNAVVVAAHEHKKLVIAHASAFAPFYMAQEAGVDIVTHVPLDKPLDSAAVARMTAENRVVVPTLTMMEGIINRLHPKGRDYAHGRSSVTAMYHAGVPIIAGTDANTQPGVPVNVPHGESLHHELELLVDAGLSNLDALRAATCLPAKHFGLNDRGVIETGRRADLILVGANPLDDIRATRQILRVWCGGIELQQGPAQDAVTPTAPKAPTDSTGNSQDSLASIVHEGLPVLNGASGHVEASTAPKDDHVHSSGSHGPETSTALKGVHSSTDTSQDLEASITPQPAPTSTEVIPSEVRTAPEAHFASNGTNHDLEGKTTPEAISSDNSTSDSSETSITPEMVLTPESNVHEPEASRAPVADHILEGASYGSEHPTAPEAFTTPNGGVADLKLSGILDKQPISGDVFHDLEESHAPVSASIPNGATYDLKTSNGPEAGSTPNDTFHNAEASIVPKADSTTTSAPHAAEKVSTLDDDATASVSTAAPSTEPTEA
ncbi:hypothetical protein MMC30_004294 [Trapelia coarctata]|nr:hypothetical protein [Trapelia coarctata]